MPRVVDHEQRKREIIAAVVQVLGEGGFGNFSLKSVADRMGGSITLVTHYYPNREALTRGLLDFALEDRNKFFAERPAFQTPEERLRAALRYFLPLDEDALNLERARIALVSYKDIDPAIGEFFQELEPAMRAVIRSGLEGWVEADQIEGMVDILRAWTSGLTLSAVEHPEIWTARRQLEAFDRFLAALVLPMVRQPSR